MHADCYAVPLTCAQATIHHDEADWSKTINTINNQPYTVTAVIAGSELGTELADQLSDRLGLKSNGPETSFLRRDKYQMGEPSLRLSLCLRSIVSTRTLITACIVCAQVRPCVGLACAR